MLVGAANGSGQRAVTLMIPRRQHPQVVCQQARQCAAARRPLCAAALLPLCVPALRPLCVPALLLEADEEVGEGIGGLNGPHLVFVSCGLIVAPERCAVAQRLGWYTEARLLDRRQELDRREQPDGGDDPRRPDCVASDDRADARAACAVKEQLVDWRAHEHLAAAGGDRRDHPCGELRAASHRVVGAIEVVRLDDGSHRKGRAARGEAVRTPDVAEQADELAVARERGEHREGRGHRQQGVDDGHERAVEPSRHKLEGEARAEGESGCVQLAGVCVDGASLIWEARVQVGDKVRPGVADCYALGADDHLVHDVARAGPLDGAAGRCVEEDSEDVANIVEPGVEFEARLFEGVRRAASLVMLLEHHDSVPALREQRRRHQAGNTGANHQDVDLLLR